MKKVYKYFMILALGFVLSTVSVPVSAQCPMCKLSAEQNLKTGGSAAKGLNKGILYMFIMPYILVGAFGFYWIRNRRKEGEPIEESTEEY